MTASQIRRMGTSVGMAGGSLAEGLNTRRGAPPRHLDPDNPARAVGSLLD